MRSAEAVAAVTGAGDARPSSALPDFAAAAGATFADLTLRTGLEQWWVDRLRADERVVIAASTGGQVVTGHSSPWDTGVASAHLDHGAPATARRTGAVPAYARACAAAGLDAASLLVVPLPSRDGGLLGALCGSSRTEHPLVEHHLATVRVVAGLLGAVLDQEIRLDDEVRRAERAEAAAHTDALTGLGNRRAWDAALTAEDSRTARHGSAAAVVVLDHDGLKELNDTAGHDAGDDVLRQVGALLRRYVREQDVVARLGGDEFGLLMPDTTPSEAVSAVTRVRAALAAAGVAVSAGIGSRHGDVDLVGAWRAADEAMYADKRSHRDGGHPTPLLAAAAWSSRAAGALAPPAAGDAGPAPAPAPSPSGGLDALLRIARAQLGADAAFISTFDGGAQRFRNVVSDIAVTFAAGTTEPRDGTYCDLIVRGEMPRVVPDTAECGAALALPVTRSLPVGSHVGVPLHRGDGSLYGTLCAFSQRPDLRLRARDADVLSALGVAVMTLVEQEESAEADARRVLARLDDLDSLGGLRTVHHRVVRLCDGAVVGSDTETRFPAGSPSAQEWFQQARRAGTGEALELAAVSDALGGLRGPAGGDGFLVVRASADVAAAPGLARRLESGDLGRLVLQVTDGADPRTLACLGSALAPPARSTSWPWSRTSWASTPGWWRTSPVRCVSRRWSTGSWRSPAPSARSSSPAVWTVLTTWPGCGRQVSTSPSARSRRRPDGRPPRHDPGPTRRKHPSAPPGAPSLLR